MEDDITVEISVSLLSVIVTFCGIVLLSVSLFVSWKLCWLPWRDKEGGGLSLTSGLLPGTAGLGGAAGPSLLPPLLQRKEGHSSSSLYPSLGQQGHPHFSDMVGLERGEGGGGVGGPNETQEHSYLDMDSYPNNADQSRDLGLLLLVKYIKSKGQEYNNKKRINSHYFFSKVAKLCYAIFIPPELSSPDFHGEEKEQVTCIGQIKPELYRPKGDQGEGKQGDTCGKICFLLRYAFK
ncbi:hypothetical protein XENOCAPTIV_010051 [Xenoophorus captivus]|uniref:Uncharacterized protein n=1 Tax=Xenoophorus captivus TaxID=1517983 RepID=A0ABV0QDW8_9TELE